MAGLGKFLKQAQRMQEQVQRVQDELARREVEGSAGGGAVKAIVTGNGMLKAIQIDPQVVNPQEVELLEDLVLSAVTNALSAAKKLQQDEMAKVTAGLDMPGLSL